MMHHWPSDSEKPIQGGVMGYFVPKSAFALLYVCALAKVLLYQIWRHRFIVRGWHGIFTVGMKIRFYSH